MAVRKYALISGILYVALGIASLVPALSTMPAEYPRMRLDVSYGAFLGLFPQNIVNKIAILVFGVAGIAASRSRRDSASVAYARAVAVVMGAAAVLGVIPATQTFFGLWPLWGNEAVLHGANALIGAIFGFAVATQQHREVQYSRPSWSH